MQDKAQTEREAQDTYARFVAQRDRVDVGEAGWDSLADFFTKDAAYIETALLAQELGRHPILVVDRFDEFDRMIECDPGHIGSDRQSSDHATSCF